MLLSNLQVKFILDNNLQQNLEKRILFIILSFNTENICLKNIKLYIHTQNTSFTSQDIHICILKYAAHKIIKQIFLEFYRDL